MTTQPPTYEPNTPQVKDNFADSQITFNDNFFTLYNAFLTNHVALDAASGAGNHTIVQFPEQDNKTQFQTDVGEISIYCKDVKGQTDQLFFRYQGNQDEFQFTNYQIYSVTATDTQTSYFTFLPGKILLCFGEFTPSNVGGNFSKISIFPPVARNIITVNLCIKGLPFNFIPTITIPPTNKNGIIPNINVGYRLITEGNFDQFYFLAVNI